MRTFDQKQKINRSNGTIYRGSRDLRRALQLLREKGLRSFIERGVHALHKRYHLYLAKKFDQKYNLDTRGYSHFEGTATAVEATRLIQHGARYEPTPIKTFKNMIAVLPRDLSDFVFIDYGSGKGRTLFMAAEHKFKRIIGIEFDKELHDTAVRNIVSYRTKAGPNYQIEAIHADARSYNLPGDKCVLYFFNPFDEDIMREVLDNIESSYKKNPRKIYAIYCSPNHENVFHTSELFREVTRGDFLFKKAVVYESIP